jgi:ribosomal protein S18 acetylase RimI-like enzyme
MNSVNIRRVSISELETLLQLSVETFTKGFGPPVNTEENFKKYMDRSFTKEKLKEELNTPGSEFYFAILENKNIGYFKINSGQTQTELKNENSLEIERIYVLQEYQGRKIGELMLDHAINIAREKNKDFIWLGVWEHNEGAIRLYERKGFEIFDKHSFMLGDDKQTDVMMKLKLKSH